MKAFEAKNKTIEPQYESVIKSLEEAITEGKIGITETDLFKEVVDRLLDDGYDIVKIISPVGSSEFIITFINAEEDRKGTYEEKNIMSDISAALEHVFNAHDDNDADDENIDNRDKANTDTDISN